MQAERSSSSSTPPPATAPQGPGAARKGQHKPSDASAGTGTAQGAQDVFASLLAALGDDGLSAAGLQADAQALPGVDGVALAQAMGVNFSGVPTLGGQDGGGALAPAAVGTPVALTSMDAALSWAGLGGLAGGLVAQTAHMDRAADRAEGSDADALGPLGAKGRGPQARWAGASTALAPASLAGGQAGQGASSVASSTVAGGGAAQEGLVPAGSASTAPVAPDMQGAAREGGVVNPLPSATHEASAPLQQALQAALQEQRGAAGTPAQPVARTTPEGAVGMAPTPERAPGAADAAAPAPDASALAGEDAMAEQVAFWVNQNSQSAEMTLDRDGQPMQVRVALSGNEAHVAFRSDQVQTREALDAGMAQLRELLQAQGLVLAGVTVGDGAGAGAGGAMPQSGQPGGEGRGAGRAGRAQVAPAPAVGSARAPVPGTRGLDVFV